MWKFATWFPLYVCYCCFLVTKDHIKEKLCQVCLNRWTFLLHNVLVHYSSLFTFCKQNLHHMEFIPNLMPLFSAAVSHVMWPTTLQLWNISQCKKSKVIPPLLWKYLFLNNEEHIYIGFLDSDLDISVMIQINFRGTI